MVRTLQRRLAYGVERDGPALDAAMRSIAHAAARSGAKGLDAVVVDGVIRVALSGPAPAALPERSARLDSLVGAYGLRVRFSLGDAVLQRALDPDGRARDELLRAVRFHVARIASRWQGALDDEDPEEVHALRGSLRRLKGALWMIGDDHGSPALDELARWARELSALTGTLRDLDVSIASLGAIAPDAAALALGRTMMLAVRVRARDAALAHLRRADVIATLRAAMSVAPDLAAPRGRLGPVAERAVARGLDRLERSLGGDLQHPEGYHCIRRRARRLRDVIEVVEAALGKGDRHWRRRLQGLQSELGDLHDADVVMGLLAHGDRALDGLRSAAEQHRMMLVAGLGPPLAMLAVELHER